MKIHLITYGKISLVYNSSSTKTGLCLCLKTCDSVVSSPIQVVPFKVVTVLSDTTGPQSSGCHTGSGDYNLDAWQPAYLRWLQQSIVT